MVLGLSSGDASYGLVEVSVVSKERERGGGGWREEVEIKMV